MAKKILIVDDSPTSRKLVRVTLQSAGFEVVEANDGVEGLHVIRCTPELALAVVDVNMPNMSGIEMLEALQTLGGHSALPVMMLTMEAKSELVARAKKAGANGWMVKPFKSDVLISVAQKLTRAA